MRVSWNVIWTIIGLAFAIALLLGNTHYALPLILATTLAIVSDDKDDDSRWNTI